MYIYIYIDWHKEKNMELHEKQHQYWVSTYQEYGSWRQNQLLNVLDNSYHHWLLTELT